MKDLLDFRETLSMCAQMLRQVLLVLPVGVLAGSASALFLWSLDHVTAYRWEHGWLLFLLPVAGVLVGLCYKWWGRESEGGNNLILEKIHTTGGGVPRRMAPLVLGATLISHLCGGSVGREGTAVQMGGSLASVYGRLAKITGENMRLLLMAGVAAGFGSVFGTPLTGAIFALEVLVIGKMDYSAVIPLLAASYIGHVTCGLWGIQHEAYKINYIASAAGVDGWLLGKVLLAAAAFGLAGRLFAETTHGLQHFFAAFIPQPWLRPALGGALVIGMVYALGTRDFLGLGSAGQFPDSVSIMTCFNANGVYTWSWLWKLLFTAVTLGSGFKGGEVTPLFFIGAALGNTLGVALGAPVDLMAALGFVAVFAGAANTPLACTLMGVELFGGAHALYFGLACFVAYYFSGHAGIYGSQRIGISKHSWRSLPEGLLLRDARK